MITRRCLRSALGALGWAVLAALLPGAIGAGAPPAARDGKTIRLVHLTDIHAASVERNPPPRFTGDPLQKDLVRSLPILRAAVEHIRRQIRPDAVVITGDLVDRGSDLASLREVKVCLDRLGCRYYPVIGDHERREVYQQVFPGRLNYGFDCGAWHLVAVDCNRGRLEPPALAWLREDLSASRDRPSVVLLHRPLVCDGLTQLLARRVYGTPLMPDNAAETRDVLRGFGQVKLVLAGHIHVSSDATEQSVRYLTTPALVVAPHCIRLVELSPERISTRLVIVPLPQAAGSP